MSENSAAVDRSVGRNHMEVLSTWNTLLLICLFFLTWSMDPSSENSSLKSLSKFGLSIASLPCNPFYFHSTSHSLQISDSLIHLCIILGLPASYSIISALWGQWPRESCLTSYSSQNGFLAQQALNEFWMNKVTLSYEKREIFSALKHFLNGFWNWATLHNGCACLMLGFTPTPPWKAVSASGYHVVTWFLAPTGDNKQGLLLEESLAASKSKMLFWAMRRREIN